MFEVKSKIRNYTVQFSEKIKIDFQKGDFLFVDENVYRLYKNKLPKTSNTFILKANESTKDFGNVSSIINLLLLSKFKKNNRLVVVGGAVCQDIIGFVASILYRGVEWVFYPTTLVAQADSCIGGKTSINYGGIKNIIGTFYPPSQVFICTKFLKTLPEDERRSGIGEMLHYFVLNNLKSSIEDQDHIIIGESLKIKKSVIEKDEFDKGARNLFNYGHTFGHSLESISNFKLKHGVAVTKGMDMANWIAWKRRYITKKRYLHLKSLIAFNMPDYKIPDVKKFVEILSHDKKNIDNCVNFILPYGKSEFRKIPIKNNKQLIKDISEYEIGCSNE